MNNHETAEETDVWSGTPSQAENLGVFAPLVAASLLLVIVGIKVSAPVETYVALAVPTLIAAWYWATTNNTRYLLTTQRIKTEAGVLNKLGDDLELYRVRDYRLDRPFALRMLNLGNITIITSDRTDPELTLRAIQNPERVVNLLRTNVEDCRSRKGVRALDME